MPVGCGSRVAIAGGLSGRIGVEAWAGKTESAGVGVTDGDRAGGGATVQAAMTSTPQAAAIHLTMVPLPSVQRPAMALRRFIGAARLRARWPR